MWYHFNNQSHIYECKQFEEHRKEVKIRRHLTVKMLGTKLESENNTIQSFKI